MASFAQRQKLARASKEFLRIDGKYDVFRMKRVFWGPGINANLIVQGAASAPLAALPPPRDGPTIVEVVWSTAEHMPELDGTLLRRGVGCVDSATWVRGEEQTVGGITFPAEMTDWLLDRIERREEVPDYCHGEVPTDFKAFILFRKDSDEICALVTDMAVVYEERD
jgi:hypothetical protein